MEDEKRLLPAWVLAAEVLGVSILIMAGVWWGNFKGGFSWAENRLAFHAFFLILGFTFFYGNGAIIYRVLPMVSKKNVKYLHAFLTFLAFFCIVVGLQAVFSLFSSAPQKVTSLHSWVGMSAVLLFSAQWVCGFIIFLVPGVPGKLKSGYMAFHQWMGIGILAVASAAILLGMAEEVGGLEAYSEEYLLIKFLAIFIILFGLVIGFIATFPGFKRVPDKLTGEHMPLAE